MWPFSSGEARSSPVAGADVSTASSCPSRQGAATPSSAATANSTPSAATPQSAPVAGAPGAIRAPPSAEQVRSEKKKSAWEEDGSLNFGANASLRAIKGTMLSCATITTATGMWSLFRLRDPIKTSFTALVGSAQLLFPFFALREYIVTPMISGESWDTERRYRRDQQEMPTMTYLLLDSLLAGQATASIAAAFRKRPVLPALIGFGLVTTTAQLSMNGVRRLAWNPDRPYQNPTIGPKLRGVWDMFENQVLNPLFELPEETEERQAKLMKYNPSLVEEEEKFRAAAADAVPPYFKPLPKYEPEILPQQGWVGTKLRELGWVVRMTDEDVVHRLRKELQEMHYEREALDVEMEQFQERRKDVERRVAEKDAGRSRVSFPPLI